MEREQITIFVWQGALRGGAEQVMADIVRALQSKNCAVVVGRFRGEGEFGEGVKTVFSPRLFPKRYVAYNTWWARVWLGDKLSTCNALYVHTAAGWYRSGPLVVYREPGDLAAMRRALRLRSQVAYALPYRWAVRELRRAALPVAASRRAERFMHQIGVSPALVTANGVDMNLPEKAHRPLGEVLRAVFVGRDDAIKNVSQIFEAIQKAQFPVHLDVYGFEGESSKEVTYHGWVEHKDMVERISKQADVVVVSSRFEAFPLVVVEALAMGVPVVISENAVPDEFRSDCIVYNATASGLVQALQHLRDQYAAIIDRLQKRSPIIRRAYGRDRVYEDEVEEILRLVSLRQDVADTGQ
jgi:glycosyltransferase involved in cell wall biosynthesis